MGKRFEYRCPACLYTVVVCGKRDCGGFVWVETMHCTNCREIVDVAVGYTTRDCRRDGSKELAFGRCPRCGKKPKQAWVGPGACPKCEDVLMEETWGFIELWD